MAPKQTKTHNQTRFRRVLQAKLKDPESTQSESNSRVTKPKIKATIQNDSSDLLIYLIYVNYMNELLKEGGSSQNGSAGNEGEITVDRLNAAHETLMKKYKG